MAARIPRRALLRGALGAGAATAAGIWVPAAARTRSIGVAAAPEGTTLASTVALPDGTGYRRLVDGPGWDTVVRTDLAVPKTGREDRRTALATIVHLTDAHIIDTQSPGRVEFLDRYADAPTQAIPFESAWRPQETLTGQVADALVRRLRSIRVGPVTGRPFDVAVQTGDNTDNQQGNELDWFLTLMDGGPVVVNSGDPDRYEGVQDTEAAWFDDHYWHPDDVGAPGTGQPDRFRRLLGFPLLPGLLEAAITPFTAAGLPCPWYSCYGNHDGLMQGNAPAVPPLPTIATGPAKVVALPAGLSPNDVAEGFASGDPGVLAALATAPARPVTADAARAPITPQQWVAAHLEDRGGPGPHGHGYDAAAAETGELYYTFDVSDEVLGICLDTVSRGGYADGAIGAAQLAWLEEQLASVHARHFAEDGTEVSTGAADRLVVLFSHHTIATMANPFPDPAMPDDRRVQGDEVEALIHRFPNVIAFVNGHTHVNRVTPYPDPSGRTGGFWEVNTAAHVDAPQHGRVVEVVDNGDGTLSIFGTLVDHDGPTRVATDDRTPLGLASLSRELAYNDPQTGAPGSVGAMTDRNVELVVTRPFARTVAPPPGAGEPTPAPSPGTTTDPSPTLPTTGSGGTGLVVGAAAVAAAAALRARGRGADAGITRR